MRRVSISGPPAAGKSTLWADLRGALDPSTLFIPDLPRQALERLDPALGAAQDPLFQHYVGYRQLVEEQQAAPLLVCDKSILDAVAYWDVLHGGERPGWAGEARSDRYQLVLICDHLGIEPNLETVQGLHAGFRDELAKRITGIAAESPARVVRLSGDREERLSRALLEIDAGKRDSA